MSIVLKTEKLNRYLGEGANRVHALKDVSLRAEAGKTHAIVGHSGSGKSTLLYLLGLLDLPDSGRIEITGSPTDALSDVERTQMRNRSLGFVFQFHFLIKEFSALENITIPMKKAGRWSESEMRERGMALLRDVGLENKAKRLGNQLSGENNSASRLRAPWPMNPQSYWQMSRRVIWIIKMQTGSSTCSVPFHTSAAMPSSWSVTTQSSPSAAISFSQWRMGI